MSSRTKIIGFKVTDDERKSLEFFRARYGSWRYLFLLAVRDFISKELEISKDQVFPELDKEVENTSFPIVTEEISLGNYVQKFR